MIFVLVIMFIIISKNNFLSFKTIKRMIYKIFSFILLYQKKNPLIQYLMLYKVLNQF